MKLYTFGTVLLSIIRSLFNLHSAMVYIIQVLGSFQAGTGWKKGTIRFFLHAYKSGILKYRVRAKRKYSYWQIN